MRECGYCDRELPPKKPGGGRPRLYCCDSHRVMASRLRKAETVYDKEPDDDSDPDT